MKPHYKPLATALAATLQLAALAAVPLSWDVRPGQPAPVTFDRYHGETIDFSATFRGFGELPFAPGADIRLWFQTNGMGSAWWSVPATIQSNVLSATWSPALDPGADRVSLFFGAPSNAYASAVLRLRHSPGFAPGTMPDPETFQVDVAAVAAATTAKTKAVMIDSPNNPVGAVYSAENLSALADALRERSDAFGHEIYLISDEPYREIAYGCEVPWVPAIYERTIVCYSYSKSLSLPGERIGWVLVPNTNPDHDELVFAIAGAGRKLGFVCAPALFQRVLIDCVDEPTDIEAYAANREALTSGLSRLGYHYIEPQGAFYLWVKSLEPDAEAFFQRARDLELLPVPSNSFGCEGWVRLGYCVSRETIDGSMPAWERLAALYE